MSTSDHWKSIFLDAYKNNTGAARRLALNEAWFAFAKSHDYRDFFEDKLGSAHGAYSYWTALVDAAHGEQEELPTRALLSARKRIEPDRAQEEK